MIMEIPIFWEFLTFDDDGISGIREEAPDEMKEAFKKYLLEEEECRRKGIRR